MNITEANGWSIYTHQGERFCRHIQTGIRVDREGTVTIPSRIRRSELDDLVRVLEMVARDFPHMPTDSDVEGASHVPYGK